MKNVQINHQSLPAIGIGTWNMGDDPNQTQNEITAIQTGIEAGAKIIDTAEMYGNGRSETLVGQAIKGYDRTNLYIISKVLPNNASKKYMENSLDASLKRLGIDYLDLYLYHWRGGVPLSETVDELQRLTTTGKIKVWGVSNFDTEDMQELWQLPNGSNCVVNEDLYNLSSRGIEYNLLDWQDKHNIPMIAYSPVSHNEQMSRALIHSDAVISVAKKHSATSYQIILAWAIRSGRVIAIPQTGNAEHMKDNIAALSIDLASDELKQLDEAYPAPKRKQSLDIL